jgi:hypothetical protein
MEPETTLSWELRGRQESRLKNGAMRIRELEQRRVGGLVNSVFIF